MIKTLCSFIAVTFILSSTIVTESFAVKHVVNVQNYVFVPANLPNVQVGDTIRWVWINGAHTTTSTTIPSGAIPWDAPITSSNPVYEYRIALAGVYNYLCTPHSSSQLGSFTATSPTATLSVAPISQSVGSSAGSTNFSVTSNSNWTAVSNSSWCTVTSSGSGNGNIVANYQINTSTTQRIANITVTVAGIPSSVVTVTQAGASATLAVAPANQAVASSAGNTDFTVTSNSSWSASSNMGWCSVTSSGIGNGTLVATYQANTTTQQRIATITVTVAGVPNSTVTVTQAGIAATLAVSPSNQSVASGAGNTNFSIVTNSNWSASSNQGWCTVTSSGSGNGTLTATYQANTLTSQRVATITVSVVGVPNSTVTVTQAGAAIILSIDPLNQNVTAFAGSTNFNVTSNAAWSVLSEATWVSATADGSGNGILAVDYEENLSTDVRIATLIVSAPDIVQMITVTQEGAVSVFDNPLTGINVYPNPSTGIFEITSNYTGQATMLELIDMKGNVMIKSNIPDINGYKLDATTVSRGTYLLKLDQEGKTFVTRVVIVE